ncbi:hypothetical protein [Streptomyces justiciae]|uniref:hypothetical protein n=1 Tax=Streptomyces justiciae TaxID=2780140 RepID=UPI002117EC80|nr:hypothetical protein [Streptomyces justiciae]MCW8383961.1 hypothetical protein [Streptomyces justiciae]
MNPPQLTADDYTAEDITTFRTLMDTATAEWERMLKAHSLDGRWAPASSDPLEQLAEADALLTAVSRAVTQARTGIRAIDAQARRRFLDRTVTQPPSA